MRGGWIRPAAIAGAAIALLAARPGPDQARPTPPFDVVEKSIADLQAAMTKGEVTSRRLVELYLARIDAYDQAGPAINAFIALNPRALETAAALDAERAKGRVRGPLHGIPIVVKDNFDTADMPTTGGSIALATLQPQMDAAMVAQLRAAGAVVIGKTNLHELAAGIVTVSSLGGQTRNPYDPTRNPGGSSGGTGAAIAANFAAAGLGSDTCGSIRNPASQNNLVGLRPTPGLTSTRGVIPLSTTQDVTGPLARNIADLAVMLDATTGPDSTVSRVPERPRFAAGLAGATLAGVRVGVLTPLFGTSPEDTEVADIVRAAIERMRRAGATIVDADMPGLAQLIQGTSVIDFEFKFDLADYLAAMPNPLVRSLGEILDRGLYHQALDATFRRRNATASRISDASDAARTKRTQLLAAMTKAFETYDVRAFVYPTLTRKPALIGQAQGGSNCQLSPSTGLPALSMPAGFIDDGLPIGLELIGRANGDLELLRLAAALERAAPMRGTPRSTPRLATVPPVTTRPSTVTGAPTTSTPALAATFDRSPSGDRLSYRIKITGVAAGDVLLVSLHRSDTPGGTGPSIARLARMGQLDATGDLPLRPSDREDLEAGRLYVQLFTRTQPLGTGRTVVK
jgi:Asp-tRNA(Asn)/Glu-tRNA(Gln) amidotransferase A subunit family amidase